MCGKCVRACVHVVNFTVSIYVQVFSLTFYVSHMNTLLSSSSITLMVDSQTITSVTVRGVGGVGVGVGVLEMAEIIKTHNQSGVGQAKKQNLKENPATQ